MIQRRTAITPMRDICEINLTPLMDLTFILLITFIITFPLIEQGIPLNLPTGKADELTPEDTRTISIQADGSLFLDQASVREDELIAAMTELGEANPDIVVYVRADEELRYKRLMDVLKILHRARIARMALVTLAEGAGAP